LFVLFKNRVGMSLYVTYAALGRIRGPDGHFRQMRGYTVSPDVAKRRLLRVATLMLLGTLSGGARPADTGDIDDARAKAIVEKADEVRFPREGFEVQVSISSSSDDGSTDVRKYRILSKGNQNTIVAALEPATERGQMMLMKARDLWIYMPNLSQPVRLSLSQRLTGQVANGDLARANLSGDYNPAFLRTEVVDGEPMIVLELTAVDRAVTYHRVLYWVREGSNRPYKAEFYSLSDRLLKTCRYLDYKMLGGKMRPTRLVMEDALQKGDTSVLEYREMRMRDLPDKVFTKDYLKHLD
jgi:outer membrane lipoprotein-sorting protein